MFEPFLGSYDVFRTQGATGMSHTWEQVWEQVYSHRERKLTDQWLHRCDCGPQRVVTSMMMIDLQGCPFCSGFPPDVTMYVTMFGDRGFKINGQPYPPPKTSGHRYTGQRAMRATLPR